jgi:hypothetical protein
VWYLVYVRRLAAFAIINASSQEALAVSKDNSTLTTVPIAALNDHSTWTHAGLALRPLFDSDRNLNVLGSGPYKPGSKVAAYSGWSGGAPNETWSFIPTKAAVDISSSEVYSVISDALSSSQNQLALWGTPASWGTPSVFVHNLNQTDDQQVWLLAYYIDPYGNGGIVFVSGDYALCQAGQEVFMLPTDEVVNYVEFATWTLAIGSPPYMAIRPLSNSDLNLNVSGNPPYNPPSPVILYKWVSDPVVTPNELWSFTQI